MSVIGLDSTQAREKETVALSLSVPQVVFLLGLHFQKVGTGAC